MFLVFMGCVYSRNLKKFRGYEEPAILASETAFTMNEVEALYELFKKISSTVVDDGLKHKEDFMFALFRNSSRQNLFADRIFQLFDIKRNGVIEFGEFVRSLSVFHPNAPVSDKISFQVVTIKYTHESRGPSEVYALHVLLENFPAPISHKGYDLLLEIIAVAFRLYDLNHTGYIERSELKEMVVALLNESDLSLANDVIETIVDNTFSEADSNGDGKIDKDEWKEYVNKNPSVLKIITLPHLMDITVAFPSFVLNTEVEDTEIAF